MLGRIKLVLRHWRLLRKSVLIDLMTAATTDIKQDSLSYGRSVFTQTLQGQMSGRTWVVG